MTATLPEAPPAPASLPARYAGAASLPARADDPVVAGGVAAIGGPLGRHARVGERRWATPLRVLLALAALTSALAWWQKSPCRDPYSWQPERQYTRLCYSDVTALYYAEGLDRGQVPYVDHPVEYPVVIGAFMEAAAVAVQPLPAGRARGEGFLLVTSLLLAGALLLTVGLTARLAGRRPWDAAVLALSPVVVVQAFTNWDLLAVACAALGMWSWARRRPALAGMWLGVGTATKLYPALLLVPLLALCWRAGRLRAWGRAAAGAVAAFAVVTVPVFLVAGRFDPRTGERAPDGLNAVLRFFELNRARPADWDSLWYLAQQVASTDAHEATLGVGPLNAGVAVLTLGVVGAVAALALLAPRRPRVAQLAFLAVAGFLLVNKVFSPQYALWLLPLAVLARPRWRPLLVWQAADVVLLVTRFLFFIQRDHPDQGIGYGWFGAAVVVRDAALVVVMGLVVREVLRPERDAVRADGVDDPAGGVLDGAPDRSAGRVAVSPAPA